MTLDQVLKTLLNLHSDWPALEDVRHALSNLAPKDFSLLIIKLGEEKQEIRCAYEVARGIARTLTGDEEIILAIHRQYRQDNEGIDYLLKLVGLVQREREGGENARPHHP